MPKKLHEKLKREAGQVLVRAGHGKKKHLSKERTEAYVYGTMAKIKKKKKGV